MDIQMATEDLNPTITVFEQDVALNHQYTHGLPADVITENGPVPNIAKQSQMNTAPIRQFDKQDQLFATQGSVIGQQADVTEDTPEKNGRYSWSGTAWIWKNSPWSANSLTINRGKAYPLLRKVRAGFPHNARPEFLNAIVDFRAWGVDPLYYLRISVMNNGSTDLGGGQGFRFEKCLKSTFETTGTAIIIHNNNSPVGLGLDYTTKGVQRVVVAMDAEPNVVVEFWIDVDQLPPYGTGIAAVNSNQLGYNWIMDPSTYRSEPYPDISKVPSIAGIDSLTINRGKSYPNTVVMRDPAAPMRTHPYLDNSLVAARATGVREGYFLRIAFIGNGSSAGGQEVNNGVSITRIPKDRLSEGYEQNIVTYQDLDVTLIPDRVKGGIQTFEIKCPADPQTTVYLTFDVDAMPPAGTPFSITSNATYGYNSIIVPEQYEYASPYEWDDGDVQVEYVPSWTDGARTYENMLMVSYKSGSKWYRMHAAKKAINQTFTPLGFSYAPAYSSLNELIPLDKVTNWTLRALADSDFHAPLTFEVVNNPDVVVKGSGATPGDAVTVFQNGQQIGSDTVSPVGGWAVGVNGFAVIGDTLQVQVGSAAIADYVVSAPNRQYTSGSHGSDSLGGGEATARQLELIILIDGVRLDLTKALSKRYRKSSVRAVGTIGAMASNTIKQKRIAMHQNYVYELSASGFVITTLNDPQEDILMYADNAVQAYMAGFTPITVNSYIFWGGNTPARVTMPEGQFTSGPKSQYPNVLGVSIRHVVAGEFSAWVDLNYGIGDRRHVDPTRPLWDHSNVNGAKIYPRLFSVPDGNGIPLAKGESYKWRGGYYWGMPTITAVNDTAQDTSMGYALVKPNGAYVTV